MDFSKHKFKNYSIKTYEKLVADEKQKYQDALESCAVNKNTLSNLHIHQLQPGNIINECTLIVGRPYLKNYVLCFDASLNRESCPVIAKLTQTKFKDALIKANNQHLNNLVDFGSSIPGIQNLTKKQS